MKHYTMAGMATISLSLAGALLSANATASPETARQNLVANMRQAGLDTTQMAGAKAAPTPIRHLYSLSDSQGKFLSLINEAGTFFGGTGGYQVIQATGLPRKMTDGEMAALRREMMDNLDVGKLIKVQYGDGGGRKILLFSAIDCPACHSFETVTAKIGKLDTTYYVMPGTLQDIAQGGLQKMETVTRIWCAADNEAAWKNFWANKTVPDARSCDIDPKSAERSYVLLRDILYSVGIKVVGTPTVIREDGTILKRPKEIEAFRNAFGPAGLAGLPASPAPVWLADAGLVAGGTAVAAPASPAAQPGKINTKDVLMKLFK
ncbi:thioredoxin fold domain-containing protein [Massilia dura]|uniref:Thioredoxin fold domain-containing protein n=1 Tax=Pseudoduganella dura TaxID=321982 RepID=A0A6I3X6Q0_9BURK|nr:thioredoxin fold domain-containing protein [Pseudoduganella dura]MUI12414.1 thioredoxin fold domain-containing protein [Pseudoduganella dura]